MSTKQEQKLHVHGRERMGGPRSALSATWRATSAELEPKGRGAGSLRLRKPEHAQCAIGGGGA